MYEFLGTVCAQFRAFYFLLCLLFISISLFKHAYELICLGSRNMSNTARSSGSGKLCSKSLLLWIFIIVFVVWAFVLHSSSISQLSLPNKLGKLENNVEANIQKLLAETQKLVSDVIHTNMSVSPALRSELQNVLSLGSKDSSSQLRALQTQINALKKENEALKSKVARKGDKPVTPSETTAARKKKWLVVGIPTVARPHNEDYLLQTLASFATQLPSYEHDEWYDSILIHVLNFQSVYNKDIQHIVFDKAVEHYTHPSNPLRGYFQFTTVQNHEVPADPIYSHTHSAAKTDRGDANHPGYIVRRQTRSIYATIRKSLGLGEHYLFLEDDMQLCPLGLHAVAYLLHKSSLYHPDWLAIRASYGMNGIFMKDADLAFFSEYLIKNQVRRPPDHLVVEYYAGETPAAKAYKGDRANIGFKYNIFNHLGVVSTLRSEKMLNFPTCYEQLVEPVVFKVEAYSPRDCPKDDVWPCSNLKRAPIHSLIDWGRVK